MRDERTRRQPDAECPVDHSEGDRADGHGDERAPDGHGDERAPDGDEGAGCPVDHSEDDRGDRRAAADGRAAQSGGEPAGRDIDEDASRRQFLKAAVAIGGSAALAACSGITGDQPVTAAEPTYPRGPETLESLPARQHAWGAYLPTNRQNQIVFPQHQLFVLLDYRSDSPPTAADRDRVERGFQTLERAFQRGAGREGNPVTIEGLLFSIGYAPSYFDRFESDLPESAGLRRPEAVLEALGEDPELAADCDAVLHLGSDVAEIVLGAEEALFGGVDELNGLSVEGGLDTVFERTERRAGLIGTGLPSQKLDRKVCPKAPVPMGFKSAFKDTLPSEDAATIRNGPFAGGTTQQVSLLVEDLDAWYDQSHTDRIEKMFGPSFDEDDVGDAGERLGNFSGVSESAAGRVLEDAESQGRVGHSQKLARARDDEFDPIILRRGDFFASGEAETVLNFGAIQRDVQQFVRTRQAMTDLSFGESETDSPPSIDDEENGLLGYIETRSRGTFLIPSRELRSLPSPTPERQ